MLIALDRNEREAWVVLRRLVRIVSESAAARGDDIYTGDAGYLEHLAAYLSRPVAIVPIGS